MAALGSLRRNSFVLISVIGMALFAFVIAGVFDGSGFQSQEPIGLSLIHISEPTRPY